MNYSKELNPHSERSIMIQISEIKKYIDENICEITTVNEVIEKFGIDRQRFYENFRVTYNQRPKAYITRRKMDYLVRLIRETDGKEIIYYYARELGLASGSILSNLVRNNMKMTFCELKERVLNEEQIHIVSEI